MVVRSAMEYLLKTTGTFSPVSYFYIISHKIDMNGIEMETDGFP